MLAGGQGLADGLLHRPGNTAVQRTAFHIQAQETRLLGAAGAFIQAQEAIATGVGVVQAFQGGRGGAQHNRDVFLACAHQRQVAGVVAQAFLLFIGAVVLFVDDDQAGVFHRREQRRAGADNNVGLAVPRGEPGFQALAVVDRRVDQRDARIEALLEARQGLRAEVDLRDQHQRLFAGLEGFADQLQIDFGLAAAGDAGQQERVITVEPGADRLIGGALFGVERQFRLGQPVLMARAGGVLADFHLHQILGQQQIEAVLAQHQFAQQLMGDAVGVLGQGCQGFTLARGAGDARVIKAGAGRGGPEAFLARFGQFALAQQHRQRPAQGVAEAVLVILGGPQAQLEQRRRQRWRGVEQGQGRLELFRRDFAGVGDLHQNPDHLPPAERHPQAHARLQLRAQDPGRGAIIEQAAQGRRQGEAQNGVGHAGGSR